MGQWFGTLKKNVMTACCAPDHDEHMVPTFKGLTQDSMQTGYRNTG